MVEFPGRNKLDKDKESLDDGRTKLYLITINKELHGLILNSTEELSLNKSH